MSDDILFEACLRKDAEIERLRLQVKQADDRGDEAMRRAHEAEAALRSVLNVDKAAPGRKDCHIWADMLECARAYFAKDHAFLAPADQPGAVK